jgi:hypothetical protein
MAAQLPAGTGVALLETARAAFRDAVVLAAAVSAVLAVTAAILTATLLRNMGSGER